MSGFSNWYQKQLAYWSAYQDYAKQWFSKPSNVKAYQQSVILSQLQAQGWYPPGGSEWVEEGKGYWKPITTYRPSWWEQLLADIAYAGNVITGMLGNPLGAAAAQTMQQYYYKHTGQQPPQPWASIHEAEVQTNPLYSSGAQLPNAPKVIVNVQNTLGNIGKAIQQGWQWFVSVVGRWGPIILLIIILFLIVKLIRG